MHLKFCFVLAMAHVAVLAGCGRMGGPARQLTDSPVVVVTASLPAPAPAKVVADVVAAPIEQEVNGVEGYYSMTSESRNDGSYVARLRFSRKIDLQRAVQLVRARVARAEANMPEEVKLAGVSVTVGSVDGAEKPVVIAVEDRGAAGQAELRREATNVLKRLVKDGAAREAEMFPGPPEKEVTTTVDRARCAKEEVTMAAVRKVLRKAGPSATFDALKKLTVPSAKGNEVPLGSVAAFKEEFLPPVVCRVNLYESVRISAVPSEGESPADAAARWVQLAEDELGRNFAVEILTAKYRSRRFSEHCGSRGVGSEARH